MSAQDAAVWTAVLDYDRQSRGFDSSDGWYPHSAVPGQAAGDASASLSRPVLEEDVRGTFQAICELSGFWAAMPCDPSNPTLADSAHTIAAELEEMARGLRLALVRRLDEEQGG